MGTPDTIRKKIVEAAKKRFTHYGYGKTTMADLACDCAMSPGNLYRYFPGKLDIAEEICREASTQTAEDLKHVLKSSRCTAAKRLRNFLFQDLRVTYKTLEDDPRLVEMAQIVAHERPEFHHEGMKRERQVLQQILEMGRESGEFDVEDPELAAEMIQAATMKFSYPQLFTRLTLKALERELAGVVELLIRGLLSRPTSGRPGKG